jgi:tetratricopeptide (TPR) repeat protein
MTKFITSVLGVFLTILISVSASIAQPSDDVQLAQYYFQNGEFDKAAMYYEKLYGQQPNDVYYGYLLSSYIELRDFKEAEKLIKKQLKRSQDDPRYVVDLGDLYIKMGDSSKGKLQYENAIKNLSDQQRDIINLANAFIRKGMYDYALETYQRGKKLLKNAYPFHYEIANLYGLTGEFGKMVDEYLTLLEVSEAYLQTIQNQIHRYVDFENDIEKVESLRQKLLKETQRAPQIDAYAELLIWLYMQKKSFASALVQVKAIDKRKAEDGMRLMTLAQTCMTNHDFKTAVKCYEYVIGKDPVSPYYQTAKMNLVDAMRSELEHTANPTSEQYIALEQMYITTLNDLGRNANTAEMMRNLALLQAFQLNKTAEATNLLDEAILLPNLEKSMKAEIKMSLADIQLSEGYIWDASLLYSQVEKDFKHDIIGHEAKFRNAKISYYTGDFEWAQAQLDVLKASTSKLIANDAMELSLTITDNFALDTIREPMERFARADLFLYQNRLTEAEKTLDSLSRDYPFHALQDEILYQRFKIAKKRKDFDQCRHFLSLIVLQHGQDILGDNALYNLAIIEEEVFNEPEKAKEHYRKLMLDYPGSLFVVDARNRFRKLRGDFDGDAKPVEEGQPHFHP